MSNSVTLTNSTVSNNSASYGGGIDNYDGTVTLGSSIVSGNTATAVSVGDEVYTESGDITAGNHNLFGHSSETNAEAFYNFTPGGSDVNATSDSTNMPLTSILDTTLADNGGPTQTHALVAGSPAVDLDASCSTGLTIDQRGSPRPLGRGCDAGSFESTYSAKLEAMPWVYLLLLKK